MKTVVLDDDPTGTQSASGVRVLLEFSVDLIVSALTSADSVYIQTNSRAIDQSAAVELVSRIRGDVLEAARRLGDDVQFVLRGDSTLRGHVFAETEVFVGPDSVIVFVPAFPAGGRITRGGVHYVQVGSEFVPANETEFADDPVFPFSTGVLVDYVAELGGRAASSVSIDALRTGELEGVLMTATAGSVVLPDAENDDDVRLVARAIESARAEGRDIVVRCAAPLAAALAGVESKGLLTIPPADTTRRVLLACGSHTAAATLQLERLEEECGEAIVIGTAAAMENAVAAGLATTSAARSSIEKRGLAILATERVRQVSHNTLDHGERVMAALTAAVLALVPLVDVVVAKGGITSAALARTGIGARSALVLGQVLPGVSVWQLESFEGRTMLYVVVPGNVGGPETLVDVLVALGRLGAHGTERMRT